MRACLLALAAAGAIAAGSAGPQKAATSAGPEKIVFARVFPNAGQLGLFISAADGSGEHPLLTSTDIDYDPVWSPDGASIVFTSDREGSADLYRVKPDGTGLERLTENPAYDDQAAFSPDGRQLVFVSTRNGGTADLWTMDLQTRRAKALTSGAGGDFRPSWSPDAAWIAFSSDRGSTLPFAHGRWEHLHIVDLYLIHPDGSGLKRITEHGNFCGSPKWSADSRRVLAYCMTAEQTLANRRAFPEPGNDTRLVSFDLASGAASDVAAGPGVRMNPSFLPGNDIGYVRKDTIDPGAGIYYTSGGRGPKGDVRSASWSPDGSRVVFHKRLQAPPTTWLKTWSRNPQYEMTLTGMLPSFSPSGDRFVMTSRPGGILGASIEVAATGTNKFEVLYQDKNRNILAPQWSPSGDKIIFGIGVFNAFFNGFHGLFLKPEDRAEGGAQIAIGALQGYLIVRLKIASVVFTLGTLILLQGVGYMISENALLVRNLALSDPLNRRFGPVSVSIVLSLLVFAAVGLLLALTKSGREIYAAGGDRREAAAAGVSVGRTVVTCFAISGCCGALAGSAAAFEGGSAAPSSFSALLLGAVAAALVGGVRMNGGSGTVINIALGVCVLSSVAAGMANQGRPDYVAQLVTGSLLIAVISVESVTGRLRKARLVRTRTTTGHRLDGSLA